MISTTSAKSVALAASDTATVLDTKLSLPEDVDVCEDDDRLAEEPVSEIVHGERSSSTVGERFLRSVWDTLGRDETVRRAGRRIAI